MRVVVQRVSRALVRTDDVVVGSIAMGLLVLVGVTHDDTEADAAAMADKICGLRIFADDEGRMNRSVVDVGGSCLVVSQFTLYGDTHRGRRPSFTAAARPDLASPLIDLLCDQMSTAGVAVETGCFGAMMEVDLVNEGPVTLVLETSGGRFL